MMPGSPMVTVVTERNLWTSNARASARAHSNVYKFGTVTTVTKPPSPGSLACTHTDGDGSLLGGPCVRVHPCPQTKGDPDSIIRAAVLGCRCDNWQDQPTIVEVWSEKSTVQGVLAPVLAELGVTFRITKSFGSFTAVKQAADVSNSEARRCSVHRGLGPERPELREYRAGPDAPCNESQWSWVGWPPLRVNHREGEASCLCSLNPSPSRRR
jgi:hypothetical protein